MLQIEIKLGTLMSVTNPGEPPRRIRMPTMSEMSESSRIHYPVYVCTLECWADGS